MLTGVRLSVGTAWLVIVAAEMLTGGVGIGFWVWDEWNNLNVKHILIAIFVIGIVGLLLEWALIAIAKRFSMKTTDFIKVEHAEMVFDTRKGKFHALRDINLSVARGEFVTLIGHSGCGKSTLLNLIAGLLKPTDGALFCDRREIAAPGPERGVVFQNHSLLPWLSLLRQRAPRRRTRLRRHREQRAVEGAHRGRARPRRHEPRACTSARTKSPAA